MNTTSYFSRVGWNALALLTAALARAAEPAEPAGALAAGPVPTETDVAYLGGDRAEKLDVWLPAGTATQPWPVLLLIHGGGWRSGDKAVPRYREVAAEFAARGYAVFSINYRLNESATGADGKVRHTRSAWPQNYEDCEAALRWIRTTAPCRYPVDPSRLVVMGGSAGAQLALLLGARHPEEIRAVVSLYGFGRIDGRWLAAFAGRDEADTAARAAAASPVNYLGPASPPLWLAHGTGDTTVPIAHARWFTTELTRLGVRYVYVEVAGAPHGFFLGPDLTDLRPALFAFLDRQLARPR